MRLSLTIALLTASSICLAHPADHHHEHGSLGTHEHGAMQMDIALEGEQLYISLHTPAADLIGFEHAPKTEQQQQKLRETLVQLEKTESLFGLNCSLDNVRFESPLLEPATENHGTHADIQVQYQLHCGNIGSQAELNTAGWFKQFPATESIQVQLITDAPPQQTSAQLTPANSTLRLD